MDDLVVISYRAPSTDLRCNVGPLQPHEEMQTGDTIKVAFPQRDSDLRLLEAIDRELLGRVGL